jgi:uncharacterized membrane protein
VAIAAALMPPLCTAGYEAAVVILVLVAYLFILY